MSRLGCVILWISLSLGQALGQAPVSFVRDIAPVLVKQCQGCHGPKKVKGGYRVDTFEHLLKPEKATHPQSPGKTGRERIIPPPHDG